MNLTLVMLLVTGGPVATNGSFTSLPAQDQHLIELRTREINTSSGLAFEFSDHSTPCHFLLHFEHRVTAETRTALESSGLIIESYLPHGAFLVYGSPSIARDLYAEGSIDWFGEYLPADKISPLLSDARELRELTKVHVMLFPGVAVDDIIWELENAGVSIVEVSDNEFNGKFVVWLTAEDIEEIALIDGVRWIEPWAPTAPCNSNVQWILQTWEDGNRRVWDMGLKGQGVIGANSDSGINTEHVMYADSNITISDWGDYPDHRKVVAYVQGHPGADFGDHGGFMGFHGSHTVGTICGNDAYWEQGSEYDGVAPESRIFFVDLARSGEFYVPADVRDVYNPPATGNSAGQAKFVSNSWGDIGNLGYTTHSWETDQFMWTHRDFLVIFASGNESSYARSPGTAKNTLMVGATLNGGSANIPADFSGSGTNTGGRIKPDVMSPGKDVWSAFGGTTSDYISYEGTSMACPGAAGATALVTQYFREGWYPTGSADGFHDAVEPSAALLKAMLINSTTADFSHTITTPKIGWGRVTLDSVLYFTGDERKLYVYDDTTGLNTGEMVTFEVGAESNSWPLRITLTWTDAPPELSADNKLVNNLNLEVYDPSGTLYYGNNFTGNYSDDGGGPDEVDVVEAVRIQKPTAGTWSIRVKATEVPEGPQPYAIVVTGDIDHHDVNLVSAGMWVDDASSSEPNGGLDPGETAELHPIVSNIGDYDALSAVGSLHTDNEDIDIMTGSASYGDILAGVTSAGNGFTIKASSALSDEEQIDFLLDIEANDGAYVRSLLYGITMGLAVDEGRIAPEYSLEVKRGTFSNRIEVGFSIPAASAVTIELFDVTGRKVNTLLSDPMHPAGTAYYIFDAVDENQSPLSNGVYYVKLSTADRNIVCKGLRLETYQ